jgi:hypothetical protein
MFLQQRKDGKFILQFIRNLQEIIALNSYLFELSQHQF